MHAGLWDSWGSRGLIAGGGPSEMLVGESPRGIVDCVGAEVANQPKAG